MKLDAAALHGRVRSGWVPASLCLVAVVVALLENDVSGSAVARFAAYCLLGLVLPGVVLWRLLVPRAGSTLLADAVFGTTLALAVELVVYAASARLGHPEVARFWPVVPLVASVVPRWRPRIWRRGEVQPVWWSWSLGGFTLLALAALKQVAWDVAPLTTKGLSNPYVDIPYQLSLVSGLSRRVRTDLPFAEGEPMYYHWFAHAHVAAERHATGIEPIVLLSRLDMLIPVAVVLLGSAVLAQRLARSPLAGVVAAGVLTLGGSALMWPRLPPVFLDSFTYISPTTVFACAILVGCIAITVELLDPELRPPPTAWVAAGLLVLTSSGAKGSALPVLLAGWVSVFLMSLLLRRGVSWRAAGLIGMGTVVFVLAGRIIYGGSSQGTSLAPFGLGNHIAADYGILPEPTGGSPGLRATLTIVYVTIRASCVVALVGLFTPRTWRDPRAHFLVGAITGGLGAVLVLDSATSNQIYFMLVTPPLLAAATGWGLVALVRRVPARVAARVCVSFLLVGALVSAVLLWPLRPPGFADRDVTFAAFVRQPLIVVGLLILVWLVVRLVARGSRRVAWRHAAPLACVSMVLGLGALTGPLHALDTSSRVPAADLPSTNRGAEIGRGGITAARWLRDHSATDDVVATNSHCRYPNRRRCDHRAFWISGYVERQILLEGWAYTSRSSEMAERTGAPVPFLPYWRPAVLRANDQAFEKPTRQRLDRLRRHQVRWLFVDKRFPVDLASLERLADLRLETGDYAVLRLD
jgi:hypothetical protein